jgi:4-amino-4-deoxychorismate lyase
MYRFIESLRIEDRRLQHIEWHNKRLNETRKHFFGVVPNLDLAQLLVLPDSMDAGVYKCRMVYGRTIEEVTYQPYIPRPLHTLRLVTHNQAEYSYKYENRDWLEALMSQRGEADDILIVKNDRLTDTSFSNIALFDGERWFTPDTFLLNGTCRQRLLAEGKLREIRISPNDLSRFKEIRPINAMLELERTPSVRLIL